MRTLLLGIGLVLSSISAHAQNFQPYQFQSPPFPLFRCDGQRPPIMGGKHCPNWQLHDQQMRVLKLQEQELLRRRQKAAPPPRAAPHIERVPDPSSFPPSYVNPPRSYPRPATLPETQS